MKKTQDYENRILLAIAGVSPAIVTETLYALTQKVDDPFIPTEVHIITTSGVRSFENTQKKLLGAGDNKGQIEQLCNDYNIERPIFSEKNIHLITDENGNTLDDITTESDNKNTANYIINKIREFTANDDTCLHVSIAGGRKTMTYYLGYAMSVFGRIQDEMSHVLVNDAFLSEDFYYPTPNSKILTSYKGEEFDANKVDVMLAYLPYIRLRDGLTDDLLNDKNKTFGEVIEVAQRQLAPLKIEFKEREIYCSDYLIDLTPVELSLYFWMLQRHKKGETPISFATPESQSLNTQEFISIYEKISGGSEHYVIQIDKFEKYPMDTSYLGPLRTKINNALEEVLGKPAASPYLIESSGGRGAMTYSLSNKLLPQHIHLSDKL